MEAQQAARREAEGGLLGMAGDVVGEAARDTLATRAMMDRAEAYAYARHGMRELPDDNLAALAAATDRSAGEKALANRDNGFIEDMAAATRSTGDARAGLLGGVLAHGIKRLFGQASQPEQTAEPPPAQAAEDHTAAADGPGELG